MTINWTNLYVSRKVTADVGEFILTGQSITFSYYQIIPGCVTLSDAAVYGVATTDAAVYGIVVSDSGDGG